MRPWGVTKAKAERGHPIFFIAAIVILAFALTSVGKALTDNQKCDGAPYFGKKHWIVMPPKWECGTGHFRFTQNH
ncbi:MAG: hypothetical protein JWO37_1505 [Acidimicrobiales bacterium]|jgi:hypothetical protein|nr:hypothetical protein [Acidimicrobiales bacterium]